MFRSLPGIAALLTVCCASGCGVIEVHDEAKRYHDDLTQQAVKAYRDCRQGAQTSMTQNSSRAEPDCFDLVVKPSPARIGEPSEPKARRDGDTAQPKAPLDAYGHVDQFALMAMFSKMVYHRHKDIGERDRGDTCTAAADKHPLNGLYKGDAAAAKTGRWLVWDGGQKGCHVERGLYFETYIYSPPGAGKADLGFTEAVIVFRGTENYQGQRGPDWTDNLASAFGFVPNQYRAASLELDKLIPILKRDGAPGLKIYTTGHSLGGGLAQMASYYSQDITAAFAFNSTPVTGWAWLREEARKSNRHFVEDPKIYRISQRSEALGILRRVSTAVNSDRFGRSDYEFDFRIPEEGDERKETWLDWGKGAVHEHDIGLLSCHMAARVVLGHADGREANFHYTPRMARNALLQEDEMVGTQPGNEHLCTSAVLDQIKRSVRWK